MSSYEMISLCDIVSHGNWSSGFQQVYSKLPLLLLPLSTILLPHEATTNSRYATSTLNTVRPVTFYFLVTFLSL